jgi:dihydroorotase
MPNLKKPIRTGEEAEQYRDDIMWVAQRAGYFNFKPLMTIAIQDSTTPRMIRNAHGKGVFAGKVYPLGVTTNSHNGLKNFFSDVTLSNFETMQEFGMPLLIHGEVDYPHLLVTERSRDFVHTLVEIVR